MQTPAPETIHHPVNICKATLMSKPQIIMNTQPFREAVLELVHKSILACICEFYHILLTITTQQNQINAGRIHSDKTSQ